MSKTLFRRIMDAVEAHDNYFVQKRDACGVLGLSCFQKVTAALRMLTYGVSADSTDEYIRIGESTALESLRKFVATIVEIFEAEYLRHFIMIYSILQVLDQSGIKQNAANNNTECNWLSYWNQSKFSWLIVKLHEFLNTD